MNEKLSEIGNSKKCPVAILTKGDSMLMGYRNYKKHTWKDVSVWTIPGGRCEVDESIEQTLRREVAEEVGIKDFKIVDFIGEAKGAMEGDTVVVFLCKTDAEYILMEPEKFSEWRWVPIQDYVGTMDYSGFNLSVRNILVDYFNNKK